MYQSEFLAPNNRNDFGWYKLKNDTPNSSPTIAGKAGESGTRLKKPEQQPKYSNATG